MKALIIGGSGFIGKHVSRQLLAAGHELTHFHRGETPVDSSEAVSEILGDRNDLSQHRQAFQKLSPDVVIDMIPMNETQARELVETFRGITRYLVVISSADVYRNYELVRGIAEAEPAPGKLTEDAPVRQNLFPYRSQAEGSTDRLYNYEKILVESVVMSNPDLPCSVLRLPATYGPGDKKHRLFHLLKRMDDGRPAILIERGLANWRWTRGYLENVAAAICAVAGDQKCAGRIYNVGALSGLPESEWINSIAAEVGWQGQIVPVDPKDLPEQMRSNFAWQHHLETDTSLIRKATGLVDPVSFKEGLRRTIEWERENPPEIKPEDFDYATEDRVLADLGFK